MAKKPTKSKKKLTASRNKSTLKRKEDRKNNGNIHPTRTFKTEDDLKKAWNEFKEDTKNQSENWKKFQYVGKEGNRVEDKLKIPLTMEGFERFCFTNYGDVTNYFVNSLGYYNDFKTICSRIRREIREDQIIGGMLGFFNPSITQRLNGLVEKTEMKADIAATLDKTPLTKSKAAEVIKKFDSEI